jgi:DNA polymerase (family 10)
MNPFSNSEIAEKLAEIADYLEMEEVSFKSRAYRKVVEAIASLGEPISELFAKGGVTALEGIPGVGKGIAIKIEELFMKGTIAELEALRKKIPVDLASLRNVQGLGPKSIYALYKTLGVTNIAELERAARAGKIRALAGFGAKSEENILKNASFAKQSTGRFMLSEGLAIGRMIEGRLRAHASVSRAMFAGSLRRRKETIGDVDVLVVSKHPEKIMDFVAGMPEVRQVYGKGKTKTSVRLSSGLNLDVRVVPAESYGAALQYFTGSKEHNVTLRSLAIKKGYRLNEYGLWQIANRGLRIARKTEKRVAGKTEEEIYKKLGLDYIEPELRENSGEIEAAQRHELPDILQYGALKGDLQVQTEWTDGADSIEAMARAAIDAGLSYIAITDHTKSLTVTGGLTDARVAEQGEKIDALNKKFKGKFVILKGTECDILKDGSLDLADATLAKLDVVGVSVHSYFKLSRAEQTARIIRAMENPHVDILFHPTGRIVGKREPYEVDMEQIIKVAKRTGTILEINAFDRLDLKDEYIRMAVKAGVKMAVDSDAHARTHFSVLEYGVAQARRGWAEKKDIVNAWPLEKLRKMLKNG